MAHDLIKLKTRWVKFLFREQDEKLQVMRLKSERL